jgi:hypothetical protein
MTEDPVAIWREAIKDDQHPRHRAAWLLFTKGMSPKGAAKLLAATKDDVILWLYEILDTEALYDEGSFGDGDAPINACILLGEWKVVEAAPRLWQIIEQHDWESVVHGEASRALENLGSPVLDFMLEQSVKVHGDLELEIATILSQVGRGDQRAFDYVCGFFERQKESYEVEMACELVLSCNPKAGIEYLEQRIDLAKYRQARETIVRRIQEARDGKFDK